MASNEGGGDDEIDPLAVSSSCQRSGDINRVARKRQLDQPLLLSSNKNASSWSDSGVKDDLSKMGKFGWCEVAGVTLPMIFRPQSECYVSVRMVERVLLSRFLQGLPTEVLTCPSMYSYRVTEVESRLLTEINTKHSDCQFGREIFNVKDLLIKKNDVVEFYKFLDLCFKKMILKKSTEKDLCGFLRIGGNSDVPYTQVNGVKFLPLFYFEGELDHAKCVTLGGWDWTFIKFCCKVQGVKDELISGDNCEAVCLEELRLYFAPGTSFVEYWPAKDFISRVGIKKPSRQGNWTRVITNHEGEKFEGKLTLIKEFPLQQFSSQLPYKAFKCLVDSKVLQSINIRPYQYKEVMITLPLLVEQLFPGFTEKQVGKMLESQDVQLYKGNTGQVEVIKQEGWEDKYDQVPLLTMKDIYSNIQSWKKAVKADEFNGKRSKGV